MIDFHIIKSVTDDVLQKSAESQKPRGHLDPVGFNRHIQFNTYLPPADLAPFLEHFWTLSWDEKGHTYNSEQVMHRPYVDVFFSKDWSGIQGTFRGKRTYVASDSGRIIGVRFLPGAFHLLWPGKMTTIQDGIAELQLVFPECNDQFIDTLIALSDEAAIGKLLVLQLLSSQPELILEILGFDGPVADTRHRQPEGIIVGLLQHRSCIMQDGKVVKEHILVLRLIAEVNIQISAGGDR